MKQQESGIRVGGVRVCAGDPRTVLRVERRHIDAVHLLVGRLQQKQITSSVGQKARPEVAGFRRLGLGESRRRAPFRRDAVQTAGGTEEDCPVAVPCPSGKSGRVADVLRPAARHLHLAQLSRRGDESDPLTVGRPEWQRGILGAVEPLRRHRVDTAEVDVPDVGRRRTRHEGNPATIR